MVLDRPIKNFFFYYNLKYNYDKIYLIWKANYIYIVCIDSYISEYTGHKVFGL